MKNKTIWGWSQRDLQRWFLYWVTVGLGFFILVFLITTTWIGVDVHQHCQTAQAKYSGDCVEALISAVDDPSNSLTSRNYAIWSLGQLGDSRAQTVLQKYYTGQIPEREPYNETISQYELKKALRLVNGATNITHFVWRWSID